MDDIKASKSQANQNQPQKSAQKRPAEETGGPAKKLKTEESKPQQAQQKQQQQQQPKQQEVKQQQGEKPQQAEAKKPQDRNANQNVKKKLPNGLEYEIMKPGKGKQAQAGKTVTVNYTGRLASNGKKFDSGKIAFRLGVGEVIKGWDQGVAGMMVGERRRLLIPSVLGYGRRGAGPDIPPNADLVFDCELLKV
eukprot:GILK01002491.1.p1 GENE.GILK01002491.1~~GILK01002491.1.p1  ORF type:complete len:227 (-),score=76.15 GILK01002491.1:82-660(-)